MPDAQAIDVSGLAGVIPTVLNAVFKKYSVPQLSEDEKAKLIEKSTVVIEKRVPQLITKYYDVIDLGIVAAPIIFDRVNQAQDIYSRVKKEQDNAAKMAGQTPPNQQAQPNQQATSKKHRSIDPTSPDYDPDLVREWLDYQAGKGKAPTEW